MIAAVTWSDVTVAGAFLAGAVLGSAGTIRVVRHVLEYLRRERRDDT